MATFDEISGKLDTVVTGQETAAVTAAEIVTDIADLKALIANQNNGGLSEGQATAIAARLDEIGAKGTALQASLADAAAQHTPVVVEPPPPVDPPVDVPSNLRGGRSHKS